MKKTLSIVMFVLLVFLAVACSPEHQHDYKLVPEKSIEATCTANGYNYMVCSCGAIQSIPTAALGHDFVEDMDQHVDSTCRTKGRKVSYCSRENCSEVKEETLPLDVNNHPFYEAVYSGASTTPSGYVGVYASLGTAKDVTYPTCAAEGVGTFSACTACGKTGEFRVVIPNNAYVLHEIVEGIDGDFSEKLSHVKLNSSKNDIEAVTDEDVDDEHWVVKKEATAFFKGSKNAICPTCGKEITDDNEAGDNSLTDVEIACKNDDICSYYIYSDKTENDEDGWNVYYINIASNPTMDPEEYQITAYKTAYTGTGTNATTTSLVWTGTYSWTNGADDTRPRSLSVTLDSKTFVFSVFEEGENEGKISLDVNSAGAVLANPLGEHSHSLALMEEKRAVSSTAHYTECECGLKYVEETHKDGCKICGYNSSWVEIKVGKNNASSLTTPQESFYAPVETMTIAKNGTYYFFRGGSLKYSATTLGSADGSHGSVDRTGTKYTPDQTNGVTILLTEAE